MSEEESTIKSQTSFSFKVVKDNDEILNESLKRLYSKNVDFYEEDKAELKQLFSKPTCILVIGKPGSGKTTLASKLALEWNLELINPTRVITEQLESENEIGKTLNELLGRGDQIPPEMVIHLLKLKLKSPEVNNLGYVLDDFPNLDDGYFSISEQFQMLKNLNLTPDYVINIRIPDEDLLLRRKSQRVDSVSGQVYTNEFFNPRPIFIDESEVQNKQEDENFEENEEEEDEQGIENESPGDIFPRTVVRPEDFCDFVIQKIHKYNNNILPLVENYLQDLAQQNFLEVDGNRNINELLNNIYCWLENMGVCKGISPIKLFTEDSEIPSIEDTDEIFRTLAAKLSVNSRFQWLRSHYGLYCPVSLSKGNLVKGTMENALAYMGKLYLLSDKESMTEFYVNPRRYLLPSCTKIPCKFWITGSPHSGKTTICNLLAKNYDADVINMKDLIQAEKNKKKEHEINEKRISITEKLMTSFLKTLTATFDDVIGKLILNNENENNAENSKDVTKNEDETQNVEKEEKVEIEQDTDQKVEQEKNDQEVELEETEEKTQQETEEDTFEEIMLKELLGVDTFSNDLIGTSLPPIPEDFPYLQKEINIEIEQLQKMEVNLEPELLLDMLLDQIQKSKEERIKQDPSNQYNGKWIIDDFPLNEAIVGCMGDKGFTPDEIISMTTENYDFLTKESGDSEDSEEVKQKIENLKKESELHDKTWQRCYPQIMGFSPVQPIAINVTQRKIEEILDEIIIYSERYFKYSSWIYTAREMEDEASEEEELDEEEIEIKNENMRQFGELKNFCPVIYKESLVLCPGNPEIPAKYRNKIYYFASEDNRELFMLNPENYLPNEQSFQPPPLRLCILGAHGCGKSTIGKYIAEKHNLFFISFRDRLQEMIIGKTQRIVGEPYFEPPEETDEGSNYVMKENKLVHKKTIFLNELKDKFSTGEYDFFKDNITDLIEAYESEEIEMKEKNIEKPDFTESEEAIMAYLENGAPIPNEILEEILSEWWTKEPFKTTGFVLEGFPRTLEDARFLLENKLFPDLFLVVNADQPVTLKRQLHLRMRSWKERDAILNNRIAAKMEMKVLERELQMQQRRMILINEKHEKELEDKENELSEREEEEESVSYEEESVTEEANEIEQQLAEEFEQVEQEPETENIEDATERIENEYAEVYDNDVNSLANVLDIANEFLLPKVEIDGNRRKKIVYYLTDQALDHYCSPRKLFDRTYEISRTVMRDLLDVGYKLYSHFKTWCPVEVYENNYIKQSVRYDNSIPVIYRHYIYYLSNEKALKKFKKDPSKYMNVISPKTITPFKIGIFGPPMSGKTTIAKKLCQNFGLVRVSPTDALNYVIKNQPYTELSSKIDKILRTGDIVPDYFVCEAIKIFLMTAEAKINGFVFDGYPVTKNQHDLLEKSGIRLGCVIFLSVSRKKCMYRGLLSRFSSERKGPIHDSALSLSIRLDKWNEEHNEVYQIYMGQYANLININGQKSKWWVWNSSKNTILEKMRNINKYCERINKNLAAPLLDLSITPREFSERLTELKEFCPVSLVDDEEFVDCSESHNLTYAAEFRARYYKLAGPSCLSKFLNDPERYINLAKLPEDDFIPKKIDALAHNLKFPDDYSFGGYCVVTFQKGKMQYEALVEGSECICSKYRGNYFCFVSHDLRNDFMKKPEKFYSLKLPYKLPPRKVNVDYNQLPILGYLEQRLATIIIKAITFLCTKKPKYPFLSPKKSALVLLAYYLKAHNSKSPDFLKEKYEKKLEEFEECCELITYLGDNMNFRTFEKEYRPEGFDNKFEAFFSIKNNSVD